MDDIAQDAISILAAFEYISRELLNSEVQILGKMIFRSPSEQEGISRELDQAEAIRVFQEGALFSEIGINGDDFMTKIEENASRRKSWLNALN